jgi:hypothetical protein
VGAAGCGAGATGCGAAAVVCGAAALACGAAAVVCGAAAVVCGAAVGAAGGGLVTGLGAAACGAGEGALPAAPGGAVSGVVSGARRITYRRRPTGSTALYPSDRSSIENCEIGPALPLYSRAEDSAACQAFASTTYVSGATGGPAAIDARSGETSTNQRIFRNSGGQ